MTPLPDDRFRILLRPILLARWLVFHVTSMRFILKEFFNAESLREICDHELDHKVAIHRLHRHVVLSNNDHLYTKIMNYCKEKCESLTDLINIMWIDIDNINEDISSDVPLTTNQFQMLCSKHLELTEKFKTELNMNVISPLMNEFTKGTDFEETVASLHKRLLLSNSKLFYLKVVELLHREHDRFQDCYNIMNKTDNYSDDDEPKQPVETSWIHINFHELTTIKSQVAAVNSQSLSLEAKVEEQKKENVYLLSHIETLKIEVKESQQQIIQADDKVNEQNKLLVQLMAQIKQLKDELSVTQKKVTDQEKINQSLHPKVLALETHQKENRTDIISLQSKVRSMAPFKSEPTKAMKKTLVTYTHWGLSPVVANQFGIYPTVKWETLDGKKNWNEEWKKVANKDGTGRLYLPPLLLPAELGGWLVQLFVYWWKDELILAGGLVPQNGSKGKIPKKLDVHLSIELAFNGIAPFVVDKTFSLTKPQMREGSCCYEKLWSINPASNNVVLNNASIPVANVQIRK